MLYTFPCKEPAVADHKLWQEAINHLCGGTTQLHYQLGRFLCPPHLPCVWFTNDSASILFILVSHLQLLHMMSICSIRATQQQDMALGIHGAKYIQEFCQALITPVSAGQAPQRLSYTQDHQSLWHWFFQIPSCQPWILLGTHSLWANLYVDMVMVNGSGQGSILVLW